MSSCSSCHREIVWAVNEATGRRMPLDPIPIVEGSVEAVGRTDAASGAIIVRVLKKAEPGRAGADRYRSHFATCPNADRHRGARA